MRTKKKDIRIPFRRFSDNTMRMMEYTGCEQGLVRTSSTGPTCDYPDEWRENRKFYAELVLDGCGKGRSAVRFYVLNTANGERYSMGMAGFYDALVAYGCRNMTICGTWEFRKQGSNYGLVPVKGEVST